MCAKVETGSMTDRPSKPIDPNAEFVRATNAHKVLGISRSYQYTLQDSDPEFPKPVRLGARIVLYHQAELRAYAKRLLERSREGRPLPYPAKIPS